MVGRVSEDRGRRRRPVPVRYPRYYPTLTLDHLWTIIDENDPHRWLLEPLRLDKPIIGKHFFELLLSPAFRRYQEANHDWQAAVVEALRCFAAQTALFAQPTHDQRAAYDATIGSLAAEVPEFAALWKRAQEKALSSELSADTVSLCGEGPVVLPWSVDPLVPLRFAAIFQRPPARLRPAWRTPYQVTLVPSADGVALAVLLDQLGRAPLPNAASQDARQGQLHWGLALVKTLNAAPKQESDEPLWQPLHAFRAIRDSIEARFAPPIDPAADGVVREVVLATNELLVQTDAGQREDTIAFLVQFFADRGLDHLHELFVSREMESAFAGTRLVHRPDNAQRIQAMLDEADASLAEEVRQAHPFRSLKEIEQEYRNRWVVLLPTRIGDGLGITAARVFEDVTSREPIEERVRTMNRDNPRLSVFAYFAGPSSSGGAASHG